MLPQVLDLRGAAKEEPRFLHGVSKHDKKMYKADKKRRMTLSTRLRMVGDIRFMLFKGTR